MQIAGLGGAFLSAAQQGMFAVDTASADQMMMSIREMQQKLNDRLRRIDDLKVKAKLGDLPEAQVIADLDVRVASGDRQSLDFALLRFRDALTEAHEALKIGMRNYEQIDAQAEQGFRGSGHG